MNRKRNPKINIALHLYQRSIFHLRIILKTKLDKDDKYGRVLAYVYESQSELISDQSFNLKLIQEGLAVPYGGGKKAL